MECPEGAYCPEGATAALPCPAGEFSNEVGLQNREGCSPCPVGTYCFAGSTAATNCSKGTYTETEQSQLCKACPKGKYQGEEGASVCNECDDGFTCPEGSVVQIPASCEPGTYLNSGSDSYFDSYFDSYYDLAGASNQCEGCPAGSMCAGGASLPRPCPRGSYCVAGMPQPTDCPTGRYGNVTGLSDASCSGECTQGYYCEPGSVSAKAAACAEGSYGAAVGLEAQANCTACPAGTYCFAGSTAATNCSKGTYAAAEGSQLCNACPEGKYQGEEGASACNECDDGFTCPEGSVVQIPASCEAGTYLNATLEQCLGCPAGSVCAGGASQPRPCPRGGYCLANVSQPTNCPAGKYQDSEGQTTCKMCPHGKFCEAGSTAPLLCAAGTFGNASGLRGIGDCEDVPPGFYAQAGSIVPTGCPSWGFCPGRQADEVNDMPGSIPIVIPDGQQTRTQTEIVQQVVNQTVLELPLQVEVLSMNALNKTAFRIQVASMLGVPLHVISLDLGASRRRLEHHSTARSRRLVALDLIVTIMDASNVDIASAELVWKNKSASMLSAELGVDVLNAPEPIIATKLAIRNATVSTIVVVECPPGFWGANGECIPCAKGTYRSGGTNWAGCKECVPGTYQPFLGGAECMVCGACHARFTQPSINHTSLTCARASQGRATTPQTPSVASLARLVSFALLARRWACAARWRIAQRMGVAQSRRMIASARWDTTWTRRAVCPAMEWAQIALKWV